jgi:predicted dehydrogenase
MDKLTIGLVGCSRGRGIVRMFNAHPEVDVTALCDTDEKKLAEQGDAFKLNDSALYTEYGKMLDTPLDAVIIATPIKLHADQTIQAIEAGKHVLCEQTVAYTVADCERVVEAVKKSDRVYMMAENYCYFHYVRQWRDIIKKGDIGKIVYAEGDYMHEIIDLLVNKETGEYYWRHERPPIWYCAHTLGPPLFLMEDRIVKGCGLTSGFSKMPDYSDHLGFLDFEIGLFQTQKGAVIKILRSQVVSRPHMVWYALYGTKGHLENSRLDKHSDDGIHYVEGQPKKDNTPVPFSKVDPSLPADAAGGGHGTSEYYMIRDFIEAVQSGASPAIDVVKACDMTIPGIIAHESAMKGGEWMDVPLMG